MLLSTVNSDVDHGYLTTTLQYSMISYMHPNFAPFEGILEMLAHTCHCDFVLSRPVSGHHSDCITTARLQHLYATKSCLVSCLGVVWFQPVSNPTREPNLQSIHFGLPVKFILACLLGVRQPLLIHHARLTLTLFCSFCTARHDDDPNPRGPLSGNPAAGQNVQPGLLVWRHASGTGAVCAPGQAPAAAAGGLPKPGAAEGG